MRVVDANKPLARGLYLFDSLHMIIGVYDIGSGRGVRVIEPVYLLHYAVIASQKPAGFIGQTLARMSHYLAKQLLRQSQAGHALERAETVLLVVL